MKELKEYKYKLSPFLIDVLQTNIDLGGIEIYDWQEEIQRIGKKD